MITKNRNLPTSELQQEMLMFQPPQESSIRCYKQTIPINIYHFYISEEIKDYKPFLDLINVLKTAEEHDRVIIYLNCEGGLAYVAIQIVNAIRASQATVITCLDGLVCSAATMIFLAGDDFIVNKHGSFMIHNYSAGVSGKGNEIVPHIKHSTSWFSALAKDIYKNFLTDEEIDKILEGVDFWLSSDEVLERIRHKIKVEDAEDKAEEEEEEEEEVDE